MAQRTLRLTTIGPAFREFSEAQYGAGVRVICIEGLMGVGKSCLLKFAPQAFTTIELDKYLAKPAPDHIPWIDQVISGGAASAIETLLREGRHLIIEGVVGWPIIEPLATKTSIKTARVYVKKLSTRVGEPIWSDGEALEEFDQRGRAQFFSSMSDYHALKKPWLSADLILERLET